MGMYTELNICVEIANVPKVIDVLKYMLHDIDDKPELFEHKLFETPRWEYMLCCDSYYFDGQTDSKLFRDDLCENHSMYYLNVRCNLKNYSSEIELFLDWLSPYIKTEGFLGYMRYEEDENPTLIYLEKGHISYVKVTR